MHEHFGRFGLLFGCTSQLVFHLLGERPYFSFVNFLFRKQIFYLFFVFFHRSLVHRIFDPQRHKMFPLIHFGGILNLRVHLRLNNLQLVKLFELLGRQRLSIWTYKTLIHTTLEMVSNLAPLESMMRLELLLLRIAERFLIFLVVISHHEQVLSETLFLGAEHFADVFSIQLVDAVIIIIIAAIITLLNFIIVN